MYKKRKYLYALFAFIIAALICIPQAIFGWTVHKVRCKLVHTI